MSDLSWVFDVSGNAKDSLAQVDQVLASMGKDLGTTEAGIKGLERALAAQNIAKINDPLRQNLALAKLHAQALREDAAAAEKASSATRANEEAQRKQAEAFRKSAEAAKLGAAKQAAKDSDELANSLAGAFGAGQIAKITGVAGAIDLVASSVKGAASFFVNGAVELFKFGLEAQQGKRSMLGMLEVFEGGRTDKVFGVLQDMGIAIGTSADQAVKAYADLRQAGFATKESQDVLAASFDIAAAKGGGAAGEAAAEKFRDLFVKFRALGKVGSKDLLALAKDVGVDPNKQLPEALAARMNVPVKNAVALLEAGKADALTVQNALLDIVQKDVDKGGPLGKKAKELADASLPAQLQRIKDLASNLFEDANFQPVISAVKSVADVLKIAADRGELKAIAERMVGLLGGLEGFDAGSAMESAISAVDTIVGGLEGLKSGFTETFDPAIFSKATERLDRIDALLGSSGEKGETMRSLGKVFGYVATQIAITVAILEKFISLASRAAASVEGTLSSVAAAGKNVGSGFANGIRNGDGGQVFNAAVDMAKAPIKAVTGTLEIKSPSRKMEQLGRYTGQGFSGGLAKESPDAAVAAAVSNSTVSTTQTNSLTYATRGGVTINLGPIIVQGGGSESVGLEIQSQVVRALEQLGLS